MTAENFAALSTEGQLELVNKLETDLTNATALLEKAKVETEELLAINTDLQNTLASLQEKTKELVKPVIEFNGKKYEVNVKEVTVKVKGNMEKITADKLMENQDAIAVLIKRGSRVLTEVKE